MMTTFCLYGVFYEPMGNPETPLTNTDIHFTGEFRDANGLQYHRARYYDPSLGVWVSLDPLETANRYGYVSGNVVNAVDPSGLQEDCSANTPLCEQLLNVGDYHLLVQFQCCPPGTTKIDREGNSMFGNRRVYYGCSCPNGAEYLGDLAWNVYRNQPKSFDFYGRWNFEKDCIGNECSANRDAVILPFTLNRLKSAGFVFGVEQGTAAWERAFRMFGGERLGMGMSGGAAVMVMFGSVPVPDSRLSLNLASTQCATYLSTEIGMQVGFDFGQGPFWGVVVSTAGYDDQAGHSFNVSGDFSISRFSINANVGISDVLGGCDYSAYYAMSVLGLPTISFTLGWTSPPLSSCEEILEPLGYSPQNVAYLVDIFMHSAITGQTIDAIA